jgi:spoIIIJ-associated protein
VERNSEEAPMSVDEQMAVVEAFVAGVVERFGFSAQTSARVDGENLLVDVTGDDLGLLIGPRGATLDALQELARTVLHRRGEDQALRVIVDVAGFRQRRAAALETFARRRGEEVISSGVPEALEPMSAADRKIVHDTISTLEGLETVSEGAEPNRYVVIRPARAEELVAPSPEEG